MDKGLDQIDTGSFGMKVADPREPNGHERGYSRSTSRVRVRPFFSRIRRAILISVPSPLWAPTALAHARATTSAAALAGAAAVPADKLHGHQDVREDERCGRRDVGRAPYVGPQRHLSALMNHNAESGHDATRLGGAGTLALLMRSVRTRSLL